MFRKRKRLTPAPGCYWSYLARVMGKYYAALRRWACVASSARAITGLLLINPAAPGDAHRLLKIVVVRANHADNDADDH
jgi:hypothetical protein